ncbi:UNVERIFIED_CONTAM: hypothetical protein H355_009489 [Colinus virginianus]|nr:hypothetical protein H355_009489 [Colinus virginianus]
MAWRAAARSKAAPRAACGPYARPAAACAAFATAAAAPSSFSSAGVSAKTKRAGEGQGSRMPLLPLSSGITLHKKFGQHLLKNPAVLDKITRAADLRSSDTVLEIGPGTTVIFRYVRTTHT